MTIQDELDNYNAVLLKTKINYNSIFANTSPFFNILNPLLDALEWKKNYKNLANILVNIKVCDLSSLENVLHRLGYDLIKHTKLNIDNLTEHSYPMILVDVDNDVKLILGKTDHTFNAIDGKTTNLIKLECLPVSGQYYFVTRQELETKNWLINFFKNFKNIAKQLFITSFLTNLSAMSIPILIMVIYDKVIPSASLAILTEFAIGAMVCIVGSLLMQNARSNIVAYLTAKIEKNLQQEIITKLVYFAPHLTANASINSQFTKIKDFSNLKQLVTGPIVLAVFDLPLIVVTLAVIFVIQAQLMLVIILFFSCYMLLYLLLFNRIQQDQNNFYLANTNINSFITETIYKLATIKSNRHEHIWVTRHQSLTQKLIALEFQVKVWNAFLSIVADALVLVSGLAIAGLGTMHVINEHLSIGGLIAVMMLTWRVLAPIKLIFSLAPQISQIKNSISQINKLMQIKSEQNLDLTKPLEIKGKVNFHRVYFKYHHSQPYTLAGISLQIPAHGITVIMGESGSGKTTISKLLAKVYQPQAGIISLDNYNIQQLDPIYLRQHISYQADDDQLFIGTVEENLKLNHSLATMVDLEHAAKQADVYKEIVNLPQKFNTVLTVELITQLPSSLKQKLILARTYVKLANLYILDEPIKGFDAKAEIKFIDNIKQMTKQDNKTFIIITNNVNLIKNSDKLIKLHAGEVVFAGNPENYTNSLNQSHRNAT